MNEAIDPAVSGQLAEIRVVIFLQFSLRLAKTQKTIPTLARLYICCRIGFLIGNLLVLQVFDTRADNLKSCDTFSSNFFRRLYLMKLV